MISTTLGKGQKQKKRPGVRLWAVAVWLIVWQLGAMALGQEILLVSPVVYSNVLGGISSMDKKLTEMADVFEVPFPRRLRYLYLPQVAPFFRSAYAVGLGLCWKAGVAAEVIGLPDGSIGERLYEAKVYLNTPDLFAWTVVIVLVSLVFEKLFLFLLDRLVARLEQN